MPTPPSSPVPPDEPPTLPTDILLLILDRLLLSNSHRTIATFAQTSRNVYTLCLLFLWKVVRLPPEESRWKRLVELLEHDETKWGMINSMEIPHHVLESQGEPDHFHYIQRLGSLLASSFLQLTRLDVQIPDVSTAICGVIIWDILQQCSVKEVQIRFLGKQGRPVAPFLKVPGSVVRLNVELDESGDSEDRLWSYLSTCEERTRVELGYKRSQPHIQLGEFPAHLASRITALHIECEELPLFSSIKDLNLEKLAVSRGHYFPEDEALVAFEPPRIRRAWLDFFAQMDGMLTLEVIELPSNSLMLRRIPVNLKRMKVVWPSAALKKSEMDEVKTAIEASRLERIEIWVKRVDWSGEAENLEREFWKGIGVVRWSEV